MICYLFSEPTYFLFSSDVPALLYYAYIPTTIIALFVGFYVLLNGKHALLNRLFFAISILFSLWTMGALIEWTNIYSNFIMFVWSFSGIIWGLVAMFCIYFIYVFLDKKDVQGKVKIAFFALLAPVFLLASAHYTLSGFNITDCDAFKYESVPFRLYYTALGLVAMIWILVLLIRRYRIALPDFRKQIVLMGTGIESFLFLFFIWTSMTYYLTAVGVLVDSRFEMYGLLGMIIFVVYISILMVRFNAFNAKLLATQALVWGLAMLIGAQFFFVKVMINYVLTGITFVATIIFGQMLIASVKKEIKQKEELALLNIDLQKLIQQRESLVHLITHKVKGSFTHTKYIFAGILEGMYGVPNEALKKIAEFGLESDDNGVKTVDLILNASNLQKGTVKYDMKPLDIKKIVNTISEEKKSVAEKKGLKFEMEISNDDCMISGDEFWLKEVVNNIIENAVRYTKEGQIIVGLKNENKKILFFVKDTGVGVTPEDMDNLFKEGGRGKNSVKVNVDSTGYGLYTVKLVVEAHGGKVWVESEGENKGSTFFVELNSL